MTTIQIKQDEHIFVCGMNGSGKTVWVKEMMLPKYQRVVFYDIKLDNSDLLDRGFVLVNNPDVMLQMMQSSTFKILYQPLGNELDGYREEFNRVCEIIYKNGHCVLVNDEANFFADSNNIEQYHFDLMTRGRSRFATCVNLSQRPVGVSNYCISEAKHIIVFQLNLDKDIDKLKGFLPKDKHEALYTLGNFEYIYSGKDRVTKICKPVRMVQ